MASQTFPKKFPGTVQQQLSRSPSFPTEQKDTNLSTVLLLNQKIGSVSEKKNTKQENGRAHVSKQTISNTKLRKFQELFQQPNLDIETLRKLSWSGIPEEVRPTVWKILLGYLPTNQDRQQATLERKRKEYVDCVPQYFETPDEKKDDYERSLYRQIHIDVPRTNPSCLLFQNEIIQRSLERVLYVWAIRHPASGYVQGINDLVTPFFVVFLMSYIGPDVENYNIESLPTSVLMTIEADCYWCMSKLLDGIQDHYTFAQPGIQRMLFKLKELIYRIDGPLAKHLDRQDAQFIQFAFRWMNCLLMRELPLLLIIRMWDTYLSETDGFAVFHVYVCAAFLKRWSAQLQKLDFQELMLFLQHLPTTAWTISDIELLLSEAYFLKTLYHDAPSHLKSPG